MPSSLNTVERQSIQEHEPNTSVGVSNIWFHIPGVDALDSTELLPPYGQHWRDRRLRLLYRGPYAWIAQAAVASLVRRVKQTPWQMEAGPRIRTYYQHLLQDAEFSEGWGTFISKVLLDFLTCDYGAYIEVIAPGKPTGPIRGRVTGLAHLDSLRCVPTGNLEYPVVYWSRITGKMHRLHHERVIRLVDMPDGDEKLFGPGLCALSRAISVLAVQEKMQRYVTGALDDAPAAGVFYNKGMSDNQWKSAYAEYRLKRQNGYKGIMTISDTNPNIGGEFVGFSMAPTGFDFAQYTELAVNAFAAAFGIDRQDLWPLTGKMSGTATQSEILMEKARGMALGDILQMFERALNLRVLPPAATFQFAVRDEESELVVAQRDSVVIGNANALSSYLSDEEVRRYLASQSEKIRDIITDEEGNVTELPDDDRQEETNETADTDGAVPQDDDENIGRKQIQSVRLDFENAFADMLQAVQGGEINRRRAGVILRGLISREGRRAYVDGLIDGGVADGTLDEADRNRLALLTSQQSQYVTAFLDKMYSGDTPLTDAQAALKPAQWYGGSIQPFYDAGRLSADANGNYECVGPVDDHSCPTCTVAPGQIHRLREWSRKNLLFPHGSGIHCSPGKMCRHRLTRTQQPARGNINAIPRAA